MYKAFWTVCLIAVSLTALSAAGCHQTRIDYPPPRMETLGDILPTTSTRVEAAGMNFMLLDGWKYTETDEGLVLSSQPTRGVTVKILPFARNEAMQGNDERPRHCPDLYARCTPREEPRRSQYGTALVKQTYWIDNGEQGAFRLESEWYGGMINERIPTMIGYIAKSLSIVVAQ
jgi:hypothetical protein